MNKKLNSNRKVTLSVREINKLKVRATSRAVQITKLFPLMILRDKYGKYDGGVYVKEADDSYAHVSWSDEQPVRVYR